MGTRAARGSERHTGRRDARAREHERDRKCFARADSAGRFFNPGLSPLPHPRYCFTEKYAAMGDVVVVRGRYKITISSFSFFSLLFFFLSFFVESWHATQVISARAEGSRLIWIAILTSFGVCKMSRGFN